MLFLCYGRENQDLEWLGICYLLLFSQEGVEWSLDFGFDVYVRVYFVILYVIFQFLVF